MNLEHAHLLVQIYSHNFVCKIITPRGKALCSSFCKNYIQFGFIRENGKYHRTALKVYASASEDRVEFRFHINTLAAFKEYLTANYVDGNQVVFEEVSYFQTQNVEFNIKEKWVLRENQIKPVEYCSGELPKNKLLQLQTGFGKGIIMIKSVSNIGKRVVIIVRPMFIDKLAKEFVNTCDVTMNDILIVQGGSSLMSMLQLASEEKINEKVIIISNKTIQGWYKNYEKYRLDSLELGYACYPHQLFEILKAGVRVVDEVHMDIHLQCKIDLYTHVERSISLSATLLSDDPFVAKMQEIMYPLNDRFNGGALNKYADAFAVSYSIGNLNLVKTSEWGSATYSHMAYEKSLLRNRGLLNNYFNLIDYLIKISYFKVNRDKKKLLVFASSIDMCTAMTNYFKSKYNHLDIRRYCEDDPYENLLIPDIRFTTILSAGTGHDIADLTTVIMSTSINSTQSNIQAFGRLRTLPDNHPVQFYYLFCKDIKKQLDYHIQKTELLNKRAKSLTTIDTGMFV